MFYFTVTEKQLRDKIQQLLSEKSDAVNKITELNDMVNLTVSFSRLLLGLLMNLIRYKRVICLLADKTT